ncbi:unnamed protein product [Camellia sinensis]
MYSLFSPEFLLLLVMEHGSFQDQTASTLSLADEDHTLANSVRFTLNQESVSSLLILSCYKLRMLFPKSFVHTMLALIFVIALVYMLCFKNSFLYLNCCI